MNPSKEKQIENRAFMSNFSPSLIQRVMLTDPAEYPSLTMNGQPRSPTVTFDQLIEEEKMHQGYVNQEGEVSASKSMEDQISSTMRQAFHDYIKNEMKMTFSYKAIHPIILEIYSMIRSLIPNRTDLHGILNDDEVEAVEAMESTNDDIGEVHGDKMSPVIKQKRGALIPTLNLLKKAAEALALLESEERSESTREWINISSSVYTLLQARRDRCSGNGQRNNNESEDPEGEDSWEGNDTFDLPTLNQTTQQQRKSMTYAQYALASAAFLHKKAELCQVDVADHQLGHILAPRILALGKNYLLHLFQRRFGMIVNDDENLVGGDHNGNVGINANVAPHLKTWLKEIVNEGEYDVEELLVSEDKRAEVLLQTGWVQNILFRSPRQLDPGDDNHGDINGGSDESQATIGTQTPFCMPETLYLDIQAVKSIRMTTKISVVGAALALHASVGVPDASVRLKADPLDGRIEECRCALVRAMSGGGMSVEMTQEIYEKNVGDAVVELAEALNPNLSANAMDMIRSRTAATMKGEDPVLKVLDTRMKDIFREMMLFHPQNHQQVPVSIRTGRNLTFHTSSRTTYGTVFKKSAREEFIKKGFSVYADELAEVCLTASRVMNLSMQVYGSVLIDKMFVGIIQER